MLLAAADLSSYNLFSGVIRSSCFIIEWRQTMPSDTCITCCVDSLSFRGLQHVGLFAFGFKVIHFSTMMSNQSST